MEIGPKTPGPLRPKLARALQQQAMSYETATGTELNFADRRPFARRPAGRRPKVVDAHRAYAVVMMEGTRLLYPTRAAAACIVHPDMSRG